MMTIKDLVLYGIKYHVSIKLSFFSCISGMKIFFYYSAKFLYETIICFLSISLITFQKTLLIGASSLVATNGCIKNIINKKNENNCIEIIKNNENHDKRASYVWSDVLNEVMQRKADGQKAGLFNTSDDEYEAYYIETKKKLLAKKSSLIRYRLGAKHGNKYFTKREAECMACLLKGKTIANVAATLKLSPRTVEYYIKNMRTKLACRTKFELIDLVRASEFMKNLDFVN